MPSITYRIRGKTSNSNIRLRFKHGSVFDIEMVTGIYVHKDHWSQSKQKVKEVKEAYLYRDKVNDDLIELKRYIDKRFKAEINDNYDVNKAWLKEKINSYFNKPDTNAENYKIYLLDFAKLFVQESQKRRNKKTGKILSHDTIKYYSTVTNKIEEYERHKNKKIKLVNVDLGFYRGFVKFLDAEQNLNPNTVGGYISKIKLFCREADLRNIPVNNAYRSSEFYAPSNKSEAIYLNEKEIDTIYKYDFSENERLDNVRDFFCIGLFSGLRVSDLLNLNEHSIDGNNFRIVNRKTNTPVVIPINDKVQKILNKRSNRLPKVISDQKFNKYIKEVCKEVGLTSMTYGEKMMPVLIQGKKTFRKTIGYYPKYELVSSHVMRRSFCTNHYDKVDTLTLMKISGHSTEKQFMSYLRRTPIEYADRLRDYWNKNNK